MTRDKLWQCQRKVRYAAREDAERVLQQMYRQRDTRQVEQLNTYHCAFCAGFHIGRNRFRKGKPR